ncbi:MAG: NUDIX hydrolase [Lachnospiraceae bacterium]|nr:NUDIX hydrolase [Lachnospiraceae bacterium]
MKRFENVKKVTDNPFLNMYDMDAVKPNGDLFKYYFATRREDDDIRIRSHSTDPDGISLFAVYGEKKDSVVLIKEFRYPINDYIYDVPAGLIEPGEDPKEAAVREFMEETGMVFEPVGSGNAAARKSAYPTVGLTDEMISTEYGYATGTPDKKYMESSEDITTVIADRAELSRIIREERIAMRALFLIMLFLNAPEDDPLSFLNC